MKYIIPKYEIAIIETEDIITASTNGKYAIENNGDGSGNIIMDALSIFG